MAWPTPSDFDDAVRTPATNFADRQLRDSHAMTYQGRPKVICGESAAVYEFQHPRGRFALRCFLHRVKDHHTRYNLLETCLSRSSPRPDFLVPLQYLPKGIRIREDWLPVVKMAWVDGRPLHTFVGEALSRPGALLDLARQFREAIGKLRRLHMAHGDLEHGNILVTPDLQMRIVDYDGVYVPSMRGTPSPELGHPSYQHPARTLSLFDSDLDNFSSLVIFLSLLALSCDPRLWRFHNGDNLIFRKTDFENPAQSPVFAALAASREAALRTLAGDLAGYCVGDADRVPSLEEVLVRIEPDVLSPEAIMERERRRRAEAGPPAAAPAKPVKPVPASRPPVARAAVAAKGLPISAAARQLMSAGSFVQHKAAAGAFGVPAVAAKPAPRMPVAAAPPTIPTRAKPTHHAPAEALPAEVAEAPVRRRGLSPTEKGLVGLAVGALAAFVIGLVFVVLPRAGKSAPSRPEPETTAEVVIDESGASAALGKIEQTARDTPDDMRSMVINDLHEFIRRHPRSRASDRAEIYLTRLRDGDSVEDVFKGK